MHLNVRPMEDILGKENSSLARSACTECQRRKQRCNREWPCNHCQKRKVADKCRFNTVLDDRATADRRRPTNRQQQQQQAATAAAAAANASASAIAAAAPALQPPPFLSQQQQQQPQQQPQQQQQQQHQHQQPLPPSAAAAIAGPPRFQYSPQDDDEDDDSDESVNDADLEALGYSAAHFLSLNRTPQQEKRKLVTRHYYRDPSDCSQLDHALQLLPPRPYADALVQNFLNNVNFHHYIVHPQSFLKEYEQWWNDRYQSRPLGLPWTSLLLMVCACSAQYPDMPLQEKLERDLGQPIRKLSEKYHTAGRELYQTIPVGHCHLYTVQQLLHSCYWFKSEARYVECWHALAAAIQEAQELGIHQESIVSAASESDREMRRRAWCLLRIWDWQIGALLSRPLILDYSECDVQMPSFSMDEFTPSPALAMKVQAEIVCELARDFGRPNGLTSIEEAEKYKARVERWIMKIPQPFTFDNPDRTMDGIFQWLVLQRHSIQTTALSMVLEPIRPYLAKPMSRSSPSNEQNMRHDGVNYALKLMGRLYQYFQHLYPRDAKFHAVLFLIFDTAALLCSAILHDQDYSMPRRDESQKSIESSLGMLKKLHNSTPTAKKPYEMLNRLWKRLLKHTQPSTDGNSRKRPRVVNSPNGGPANHTSPGSSMPPPDSDMGQVAMQAMPHNYAYVTGSPGMQSGSPPYQMPDNGQAFVPSPSSGISGVDGSFILSTSPSGPLNGTPVTSGMPYMGGIMAPDENFPDVNFNNISEAELGALAGLWDYNSLNLDYMTPYTGPTHNG